MDVSHASLTSHSSSASKFERKWRQRSAHRCPFRLWPDCWGTSRRRSCSVNIPLLLLSFPRLEMCHTCNITSRRFSYPLPETKGVINSPRRLKPTGNIPGLRCFYGWLLSTKTLQTMKATAFKESVKYMLCFFFKKNFFMIICYQQDCRGINGKFYNRNYWCPQS